MTAEELIEALAQNQDRGEICARRGGAFDAAVCYQQFAAWFRDGTFCLDIRGVDSTALFASFSNGLTHLRGDAYNDAEALRAISEHILERADELELAQADVYAANTVAMLKEFNAALDRLWEQK